jgi:transposase
MDIIAMDVHKRYSQVCIQSPDGQFLYEGRLEHQRGSIQRFLQRWNPGSPVAIETVGNWYWVADEIEAAGMEPLLVHAAKAKQMLGCVIKTDKLDARGLNRLQRTGTLPTVWIPPGPVRDQRALLRTRMAISARRTAFKNRVIAELDKYGLGDAFYEISDAFGIEGRKKMDMVLDALPPHTRYSVIETIKVIDVFSHVIERMEKRLVRYLKPTEMVKHIMSLPGTGLILGSVMAVEIGLIGRFPSAQQYASYAGTTPRVHSSGGKTRYGRCRQDVNHYLKWAYVEAASNLSHRNSRAYPHARALYLRIREKKGHGIATVAVARHLAEASWWMLQNQEDYREPRNRRVEPTKA